MNKSYALKTINQMLFSMRFVIGAFLVAAILSLLPELAFAADPADALRQTTDSFLNNEFLTIKKLIMFFGILISLLLAVKNQSVMILVAGVAIVIGGGLAFKFINVLF